MRAKRLEGSRVVKIEAGRHSVLDILSLVNCCACILSILDIYMKWMYSRDIDSDRRTVRVASIVYTWLFKGFWNEQVRMITINTS